MRPPFLSSLSSCITPCPSSPPPLPPLPPFPPHLPAPPLLPLFPPSPPFPPHLPPPSALSPLPKERFHDFVPALSRWSGLIVGLTLIAIGCLGVWESVFEGHPPHAEEEEQVVAQLALAGRQRGKQEGWGGGGKATKGEWRAQQC